MPVHACLRADLAPKVKYIERELGERITSLAVDGDSILIVTERVGYHIPTSGVIYGAGEVRS